MFLESSLGRWTLTPRAARIRLACLITQLSDQQEVSGRANCANGDPNVAWQTVTEVGGPSNDCSGYHDCD